MRLKGVTVGAVPRLFISRHQCVVLMSLLALCLSVGMGINISGIDLCDHQCAAFEITFPVVCHLSCDLALLFALLLFTVLCSSSNHISLYHSLFVPGSRAISPGRDPLTYATCARVTCVRMCLYVYVHGRLCVCVCMYV